MPEGKTAYKPSGRIPLSGLIVFLPTAAAAVVCVVCVAVCVGGGFMATLNEPSVFAAVRRKLHGLVSLFLLFVDLSQCTAAAAGPGFAIGWLRKQWRIRSFWLPGLVAGVAGLLMSGVLFLPVQEGTALGPVDISLWIIGLRWPIIIIGMASGLFGAPALVVEFVSKQKFCELRLVYLKLHRTIKIRFDGAGRFGAAHQESVRRGIGPTPHGQHA